MPKQDPNIVRRFMQKIIQQPFNAVNLNRVLFGEHTPRIPREVWVMSQIELIKEIGLEAYFFGLLDTLENPLTTEEYAQLSEDQINEILKRSSQRKPNIISPYFFKKD